MPLLRGVCVTSDRVNTVAWAYVHLRHISTVLSSEQSSLMISSIGPSYVCCEMLSNVSVTKAAELYVITIMLTSGSFSFRASMAKDVL